MDDNEHQQTGSGNVQESYTFAAPSIRGGENKPKASLLSIQDAGMRERGKTQAGEVAERSIFLRPSSHLAGGSNSHVLTEFHLNTQGMHLLRPAGAKTVNTNILKFQSTEVTNVGQVKMSLCRHIVLSMYVWLQTGYTFMAIPFLKK